MLRIIANNAQVTLASYCLALFTHFADSRSDFHIKYFGLVSLGKWEGADNPQWAAGTLLVFRF
jgi:hypothetical protein